MGRDRSVISTYYCGEKFNLDVDFKKNESSHHPYSPNTVFGFNPEAEMYWLQFSDFYDWPFVQYFDSYEDLVNKYKALNLQEVSQGMLSAYALRQRDTFNEWCEVLPLLG